MSAATSRFINIAPEVRIHASGTNPAHVSDSITPPSLVFLHFWGGSSRTWSIVIDRLADQYRTVAIDFRGWGKSLGPSDAQAYSTSTLADDVEAIIADLRLEKVVLIGLSMGAKVGQLIAGRRSLACLSGLILVSPAPATPLQLPIEMREQQIHAYDNAETANFVARHVLTASYADRHLPSFVVEDMLQGSKAAKEAWPTYAMGEDVSGSLQHINVPVVVLAAELDVVEPLEKVMREVVDRVPNAKSELIQGSGHLSPLDAPVELAERLKHWLEIWRGSQNGL